MPHLGHRGGPRINYLAHGYTMVAPTTLPHRPMPVPRVSHIIHIVYHYRVYRKMVHVFILFVVNHVSW